jgi:glutathione peroxidase
VLGEKSTAPGWNFNKYLVDPSGQVIKHFGSSVQPNSSEVIEAIHTALGIIRSTPPS